MQHTSSRTKHPPRPFYRGINRYSHPAATLLQRPAPFGCRIITTTTTTIITTIATTGRATRYTRWKVSCECLVSWAGLSFICRYLGLLPKLKLFERSYLPRRRRIFLANTGDSSSYSSSSMLQPASCCLTALVPSSANGSITSSPHDLSLSSFGDSLTSVMPSAV